MITIYFKDGDKYYFPYSDISMVKCIEEDIVIFLKSSNDPMGRGIRFGYKAIDFIDWSDNTADNIEDLALGMRKAVGKFEEKEEENVKDKKEK